MKCWMCGNELTTGDAPNTGTCRQCAEKTRISSVQSTSLLAVRCADCDGVLAWRWVDMQTIEVIPCKCRTANAAANRRRATASRPS